MRGMFIVVLLAALAVGLLYFFSVGGKDKGVSLGDCALALVYRARAVVCVGESGPSFARAVRDARGRSPQPSVHECDGLEDALPIACSQARPGDVVLFAPGGPSFDRYANFEQRGQHFVDLVGAL